MNERIKQLAEQAGLKQRIWNSLGKELPIWQEDPDNPGLEKFAELIVRECIRVPYDMWDKAELNADIAVKIEYRIKDHFGVEE